MPGTSPPTPPTTPPPPAVDAPAWTDAELASPHRHEAKADKVRGMFAAIARSYDLNNRVHSLWRDQAWRRFAVRTASPAPTDRVLDVACGTGDLTQAFARAGAAEVIGLDFTPAMLDVAREKARALPTAEASRVRYMGGDAQQLPFPDASFDIVSIAFGIRNVADPGRALAEFARVLRPGGRLVVLEFDRPSFAPLRWFNDFYCGWVMPRTATAISRDTSGAYRYLPASVGTFMTRREMEDAVRAAGFTDVTSRGLTLGICVCYRGVKPLPRA
ncbi:MAG: bifunctional demethylmenaquinone methyltransferase/2-methoxy-6-polyprenyl-1,4-benzoquinol methylase UbiE [Phycisphaeraceae bacterium]|nr:MAG: bifunctional demethylmenaquinone methyltransferase/2-methoxy-6-polyprenyl-1,4-benzoquinol methylase UbiE [Phycisphaeraceae bacterium]